MPTEFREIHAECARNVPLDRSRSQLGDGDAKRSQRISPLYLICRSGNRSAQACKKFMRLRVLKTSSTSKAARLAWDKAGLPVVRGKKSLPLAAAGANHGGVR